MGFPRQEYWSGLPFPSPEDLPDPGIEPGSPALQADSTNKPPGKPCNPKVPHLRIQPKAVRKYLGKNNYRKFKKAKLEFAELWQWVTPQYTRVSNHGFNWGWKSPPEADWIHRWHVKSPSTEGRLCIIEKHQSTHGPTQLKSMLFNAQLYLHCI